MNLGSPPSSTIYGLPVVADVEETVCPSPVIIVPGPTYFYEWSWVEVPWWKWIFIRLWSFLRRR